MREAGRVFPPKVFDAGTRVRKVLGCRVLVSPEAGHGSLLDLMRALARVRQRVIWESFAFATSSSPRKRMPLQLERVAGA